MSLGWQGARESARAERGRRAWGPGLPLRPGALCLGAGGRSWAEPFISYPLSWENRWSGARDLCAVTNAFAFARQKPQF